MTAVEPILVAFLVNRPEVTNLIGTGLYPNVAPEGAAYPHVTYYRVSTARKRCYAGTVGTNPTVQFDCWARSYPEAKAVALAIGDLLNDFAGNVQGAPVRVQGVFLDEESDDYEKPEQADEIGVHKASLTVRVFFPGK